MDRKILYIWDINVFNTYRYSVVPHETCEDQWNFYEIYWSEVTDAQLCKYIGNLRIVHVMGINL